MAILIRSTGCSMNKRMRAWPLRRLVFGPLLLIAVGCAIVSPLFAAPSGIVDAIPTDQAPVIKPDYRDVIIPPNIAPLNFSILEPGARFFVKIHGRAGEPLELT